MKNIWQKGIFVFGIVLCLIGCYLFYNQYILFNNELTDQTETLNKINSDIKIVEQDVSSSMDIQIETVVSVLDRAEAKCKEVADVENDVNNIIYKLSDVNLDIDESELYSLLFEDYDYIDSVFGEDVHLDIPWFALNMKESGASGYRWNYYVSKNVVGASTDVLFVLENKNNSVLMYLCGVYDAETDMILYLYRRGTSEANSFMLYTEDNNDYQGDMSQEDFNDSVFALLDELSADEALYDLPEIDASDPEWDDIIEARDIVAGEANDPLLTGN